MTLDTGRFERMLRERLNGQVEDARSHADSLAEVRAARADGTADDEHDPEGSTLTLDWSRIAGFAAESDSRMRDILAALDRIAQGAYGVCASCDRPIGEARLVARPWADRCIECAALEEQRRH